MGLERLHQLAPESVEGAGSEVSNESPYPAPDKNEHLDYLVAIDSKTGMINFPPGVAPEDITATYLGSDGKWRISTRPEMLDDRQNWP